MMKNEAQINEVRTILLSLLVANQHNLPLVALDREYFQVEKERIPWRKFGYESLQVFLESMPQHFSLYNINGITYVKGIASEKSMHVKSLVNRQKSNTKPRYSTHTRNQNVYLPPLLRTPMRISASMLSTLLQYISKFPSGISIQNAMQFIQTQCPNIKLSAYDLKAQLREVSHQVYLDNNMIYFRFNTSQRNGQCSKSNSQGNSYASSNETLYVAAGVSDEEDCVDNIDVAPGNYVNDNQPRRSSEEFAADLLQNTNQMQNGITNNYDDVNVNELATARHNAKTNEIPYSSRVCALISDKIKSRLRELVQKYPDGITCAELPDKYLKEFKIHLNYVELGFSSVREFVLYLPQIFYLEQLDRDGDYLLLSADKRPTVPDQESPKENIENKRNSRKRNEEEYKKAEDPPVPTDIPPNIANRAFVPENAINYYESVKLIPVTELRKEKFLEVYISEVFNPSFFWVHLRRYKNQLINLMEDINEFYNRNFTKNYLVPKVGLMKGLHCACIYDDKWHRGVIKSVKPDFQVTILFIDYGTVKTYPPDNICYLDKRFIHLPVQAIPCGLINIKPHIGDRWNSTTNRYFCDKVSGPLLAATIHSIDIAHNSMMIVLTDTSEEEEVHINDWLVNEKLARRAKTVRMCYFLYFYKKCDACDRKSVTQSSGYVKKSDAKNTVNIDRTRDINKRAHGLSDRESEDTKSVGTVSDVPFGANKLLHKLHALGRNSQNSKSQSETRSEVRKPKLLEKLAAISERLRTTSATSPSNSSVCTSETNENSTRDTRERDVETRTEPDVTSECKTRDFDDGTLDQKTLFGNFYSIYGGRGHGVPCNWSANPEDDSSRKAAAANPGDDSSRKAAAARNSSKLLTKLRLLANTTESESESQRSVKAARPCPYFQQLAQREAEGKYVWSPEMNIKRVAKNMSQTIASLKQRMEIPADEYIAVTVPENVLEIMCDSDQSRDTLNSTASSVEIDSAASCNMLNSTGGAVEIDVASPRNMLDSAVRSVEINGAFSSENLAVQEAVNSETRETRSNQEIERDGDSNADVSLISSKCDSRSESDTADKVAGNNKYKGLLDDLVRNMQKNSTDTNLVKVTKSSSSEEQSQTPSRNCSSNGSINSSNNSDNNRYAIISTRDERHETLCHKIRRKIFNEPNASSKGSNLDNNKSEMIKLLPSDSSASSIDNSDQDQPNQLREIGSTALPSDDSRRRQANCQILENDTTVSSLVDDSEQQSDQSSEGDSITRSHVIFDSEVYRTNGIPENNSNVYDPRQPNVTANTSLVSKFQQVLKVTQSLGINDNSDLDSDDLSDSEDNNNGDKANDTRTNKENDKSDKSRDKIHSTSDSEGSSSSDKVNDTRKNKESDESCDTIRSTSDETSVKGDESCDEGSIQVIGSDGEYDSKNESENASKCTSTECTRPSSNRISDEILPNNDCDIEFSDIDISEWDCHATDSFLNFMAATVFNKQY